MVTQKKLADRKLAETPPGEGRFQITALKELAEQQVRFAPPARRQEQMARAEKLRDEVEPGKQYPYQYICFRITDYRPEAYPDLLIDGAGLRHDLWLFLDELSRSLPPVPVEELAEPVLTLDQISQQLNVSTKTISRWREQGLIGRRVLYNGRWQLGFPQSVVQRFVAANPSRVQRGSRFSQLSDDEKEDILRRAKRMARVSSSTLTEVARRIARRLGRSPETVRYTIKNYDRQHPEAPLFPEVGGPLPEDTKQAIYDSFRRGIGVDCLARRFHRTRTSIYRVLNEVKARRLLSQPLEAIYHASFDDPAVEAEIVGPMPEADEYEMARRQLKLPKDVPPELAPCYEVPLLNKAQEQHLFRQMNFYKHKASQLRAQLDPRHARTQEIEKIEELQRKASAVKDRLVSCNLRLVVSIAKRHVDQQDSFFELQSDGNMSLIRAVDKFDFGRGYKFSTYATWAIMKNFARSIPDEKHRRERYQTGKEELFDIAPDARSNEKELLSGQEQSKRKLYELLEQLDPRERLIVRMRAGLDNYSENMTLEEIGQQLGITKERVRQLNLRAMKHLESLARETKDML